MFEREHHRNVALVLQALDPAVLTYHRCYFGGGTAMALRYGEYRESVDIDFLVSDTAGYRELRQALGGPSGLMPLTRPGMPIQVAREIRTDQYGIRTLVHPGKVLIKFEIMREARIEFAEPLPEDRICGVATLRPVDLAAEKLLANADRWRDDAVHSRDIIDLAMQQLPKAQLTEACAKAEVPYGRSIRESIADAAHMLRTRPERLGECMRALALTKVSAAQLLNNIRRLARYLAPPATPADWV